jgi:hypothetical protein
MSSPWQDVGCVRIPAGGLPVLADLRGRAEIRVSVVADRAWIAWKPGPGPLQQALLRRLLPLPGAETFLRRGGRWYRPGESLPAFEVPANLGSEGDPLERILLPRAMKPIPASDPPPSPVPIRLLREERGRPRPAVAILCRLDRLAAWAERASAARLAALAAAWAAAPGDRPGDPEVLVLGATASMPEIAEGLRLWGGAFLVPLGFRPDPDLPEPALCRAAGAEADDLVLALDRGFELLPREAFRPLTRASIRLARGGGPPGRAPGGLRP